MKAASLHALARALGGKEEEEKGKGGGGGQGGGGQGGETPEATGMEVEQQRVVPVEEQEKSDLRKLLYSRLAEMNGSGAGSTTSFLLQQLQSLPIPTVRHAIYDVLVAVAKQEGAWGIRSIFSTAGFREFLENRTTERDKAGNSNRPTYLLLSINQSTHPPTHLLSYTKKNTHTGKEWKYSLIERIVHENKGGQSAPALLNEEILEGLRGYLRLGPFYVGRQAEVETMM